MIEYIVVVIYIWAIVSHYIIFSEINDYENPWTIIFGSILWPIIIIAILILKLLDKWENKNG